MDVKRWVFTLLSVLCVGLIFWNSSRTGSESSAQSDPIAVFLSEKAQDWFSISWEVEDVSHAVRKTAHIAEFAILSAVFYLTARSYRAGISHAVPWALLLGLLTAAGDEFIQSFVPGRSSEVQDVLIDFCGVALGTVACALISRLRGGGRDIYKVLR